MILTRPRAPSRLAMNPLSEGVWRNVSNGVEAESLSVYQRYARARVSVWPVREFYDEQLEMAGGVIDGNYADSGYRFNQQWRRCACRRCTSRARTHVFHTHKHLFYLVALLENSFT